MFGPVDLSDNVYRGALMRSAIARDGYVAAVVTHRDDPRGTWISPSGVALASIEATNPDTLPYSSGFRWLRLSDGSLAAHGSFHPETAGWGWKSIIHPDGSASAPPSWLTERSDNMFVLPGAIGYAEAFGAHEDSGVCAARVELYSNSEEHCGSVRFKVQQGGCDASLSDPLELGIGLDGTVIMEVAPAAANITCAAETCACVRWWWPNFLR